MKKRIATLLFASALLLSLAACGEKEPEPRYALITTAEKADGAVHAAISEKMFAIAESDGELAAEFIAAASTNEAINRSVDEAKKAGAKLILADGIEMEMPFYRAQNKYHKLKFMLLEAVPRGEADADDDIRSNTMCVEFNYEEEGYLCGYIAVKEGYRSLGYIAGRKSRANERYLSGFIAGADAAATELDLAKEAVSITALFAGTEVLTPLRMSDTITMLDGGVELFFAVGENVTRAVDKGLYALGRGKFVTAGQNMTDSKTCCLFSLVPDVSAATERAIKLFETGAFRGGETVTLGFSESCLNFVPAYERMSGNFTEDDFKLLQSDILTGGRAIENGVKLSKTEKVKLAVIENAEEETLKIEDVISPAGAEDENAEE